MGCKKEPYPTKIFPHQDYQLRLDVDKLLTKYPELMIVRQVEGKEVEYIIDVDGELVIDTRVFKNNMANLSLNLAGGLFDVDPHHHLKFLPDKTIVAEWNGERVNKNLCVDENSYKIAEHCFALCFYVSEIHRTSFPFYRHFVTKSDRDRYYCEACQQISRQNEIYDENIVGMFDEKKKEALVRPSLFVNHMPTHPNYWHVTIDTHPPNMSGAITPDYKQNNQDRKMFEVLKKHLVKIAEINSKPTYRFVANDYKIGCALRILLSKLLLLVTPQKVDKKPGSIG